MLRSPESEPVLTEQAPSVRFRTISSTTFASFRQM